MKGDNGQWHGLNLTYYRFFNACACTLAVGVVCLLLAATGLSLGTIHIILAVTLAPCIPAAKWVARWVEKKAHTFSIGGAAHMAVDILQGLLLLWNPSIIILCQIQWIGIFIYMGRSQVTGSRISFLVHKDRI